MEAGETVPFPTQLLTLPIDHPLVWTIEPDEIVLRRFASTRPSDVSTLSGIGGDMPQFAMTVQSLGSFSDGGCSVFREGVLTRAGLDRTHMVEDPYLSVAAACVGQIDGYEFRAKAGETRPFQVVADPYPDDEPRPIRAHVGHAVIQFTRELLTRTEQGIVKSQLAATVFAHESDHPSHLDTDAD